MINLVIVSPQIPPNTGNIARTCAATGTPLHIIGPIGFEINDRQLKRAGLDYWPNVNFKYHKTFQEFRSFFKQKQGRWIGFSTKGACNYTKYEYHENDWLFFGSETEGLPKNILESCHATLYIPIINKKVRCLNLAVCAGIGLYEAQRQLIH